MPTPILPVSTKHTHTAIPDVPEPILPTSTRIIVPTLLPEQMPKVRCIPPSSISMADVSGEHCVKGIIISIESKWMTKNNKQTHAFFFKFDKNPKTVFLILYSNGLFGWVDTNKPVAVGDCVSATGEISIYNNSPVLILNNNLETDIDITRCN